MSFWYIARANELLLDLDDYMRPTRTGEPWGEIFFRKRLRAAIEFHKLDVSHVYLARSNSEHHFHAIVRLSGDMQPFQRMVWQLQLGSDLYRCRADMMRLVRGFIGCSLLIREVEFTGLYRSADVVCKCTTKHVTSENPDCDVWRRYRGCTPWELFGESSKDRERFVPLPLGDVPLELILRRELE